MSKFRYHCKLVRAEHVAELDKTVSVVARESCRAVSIWVTTDRWQETSSELLSVGDWFPVTERDDGITYGDSYIELLGGLGGDAETAFLYLAGNKVRLGALPIAGLSLIIETPNVELTPINRRTSEKGRVLHQLAEPCRLTGVAFPPKPAVFPAEPKRKTKRRSSAGQIRILPTVAPAAGRWF
jgi:hypothetical protein